MYIINIVTAWIGIINGTDSICDLFFFYYEKCSRTIIYEGGII